MVKDKDSRHDQTKSSGSKLPRNGAIREKDYLRKVKTIARNAADKGLTSRKQTIELVKLMQRIEDSPSKFKLLKILANTNYVDYLKLFLNNHGLKVLYIWMMQCKEADFYLKIAILKILAALPVSSKTTLKTTKVWDLVKKWSNYMEENDKDDIQVVYTNNSEKHNDEVYQMSDKACVSGRSSEEISDWIEIVESGEDHFDQRKIDQITSGNEDEISNDCEQNIKSINRDADCDTITEIGNKEQNKCFDRPEMISEDFVQDIILKMSIILKERKKSNSKQSEINLESPSQNNTIHCDKKSSNEPSRVSISSTDALSDCHKPANSLNSEIDFDKSKDKVHNCANNTSSSKRKNWTAADVSVLALKLLEQWKDLKEVFKIPKIKPTESVEIERNDMASEKIKDSSKTAQINNDDKRKDKKDNNQGNKEVNQKSKNKPSQDVPKKSNVYHKRHRVRHRNRKPVKPGNSFPLPEFRYEPQYYLGLVQERNLNYEYYPSYCYLNQLPWQMPPVNYNYY